MSSNLIPFVLSVIVVIGMTVHYVRHRLTMRSLDRDFNKVAEAVVFIKSLTWHEKQKLREVFPDSSDLIGNVDRAREVVSAYREMQEERGSVP